MIVDKWYNFLLKFILPFYLDKQRKNCWDNRSLSCSTMTNSEKTVASPAQPWRTAKSLEEASSFSCSTMMNRKNFWDSLWPLSCYTMTNSKTACSLSRRSRLTNRQKLCHTLVQTNFVIEWTTTQWRHCYRPPTNANLLNQRSSPLRERQRKREIFREEDR